MTVLTEARVMRPADDDGGRTADECEVVASKMQSGGVQMRREKRNRAVFKSFLYSSEPMNIDEPVPINHGSSYIHR
jgi:hypothetical protein